MTSTIKVNKIEKVDGSTIELGGPGTAVNLACGATQTGFGRTGTVDWCTTAKTSPFTATNGSGFFVNTTGGAITVTLPSSPTAGDIVAFKDYADTWGENNLTINPNGSKLGNETGNAILNVSTQSVTLVFADATRGWQTVNDSTQSVAEQAYVAASGGNTTVTCGDFKIHTFTSNGTFTVTDAGNAGGSNTIDYLIVAGGGGSGTAPNQPVGSGGGGAGGYRASFNCESSGGGGASETAFSVTAGDYTISVGAGGAGGPSSYSIPVNVGTSGGNSVICGSGVSLTSAGGGGGGGIATAGAAGGSGGGGANSAGGAGTTNQGFAGGGNPGGGYATGAGGGGAGAVGQNQTPAPAAGGAGVASTITGSSVTRAGGGGGGGSAGGGGTGGGGAGSPNSPGGQTGTAGTVNTGGGAGGSFANLVGGGGTNAAAGAAGGSGIVILRYKFQN